MSDELELLRRERPDVQPPSPEGRRKAERALRAAIEEGGTRRRRRLLPAFGLGLGWLAPVAAVLVVLAVVVVFLGGHSRRSSAQPATAAGLELAFRAQPVGSLREVKVGVVSLAASLLQQLIGHGDRVRSSGDRLTVRLSDPRQNEPQLLSLIDVTGRLAFYDWEVGALTPGGRPVASLLTRNDPAALRLSQGGSVSVPGSPGAGGSSLYTAVQLASRQPQDAAADNGRPARQYFAFGAPGSPDCVAAAHAFRTRAAPAVHCYLGGPAPTAMLALGSLPAGVSAGSAQVIGVPRGTVVLQSVAPNPVAPRSLSDPTAQFYVLRDHVGLFGYSITKPSAGTDASGSPDVAVQFTAKGARAFQTMTARVAHRGDLVSRLGQTLNQHFAIALGDQLLAVPSIDFRTYPDGVPATGGANVTGGYTPRTARRAAIEIQLGSLPITLELVSAPSTGDR